MGRFTICSLCALAALATAGLSDGSLLADAPPPTIAEGVGAEEEAPSRLQQPPATGPASDAPITSAAKAEAATAANDTAANEIEAIDVEFSRRGTMRMTLKMDALEMASPYGALVIPVRDLVRIDFATRLDETDRKRVEEAIGKLGNTEFAVRRAAMRDLAALGERAYPALLTASKDRDPEVAGRATELINSLKQSVPEERLVVREYDIVETVHSKIAGHLRAATLAVETQEFGGQQLKLSDIRSLRSKRAPASDFAFIQPQADPGNMTAYTGQVGKTFCFTLTGRIAGTVYGTNQYTTDTSLCTAAVHAGVLKVGETANVRVTMIASPASFAASTQNGVTSNSWSAYPAAYKFDGKQVDERR